MTSLCFLKWKKNICTSCVSYLTSSENIILNLKPSKCSLFKEKINYLAHQVSKQGVRPSDTNLKAITECAPPRTYTEIRAFLGLVGHYRWFIRGFAKIAQPLNEHLVGKEASKKSEQVSLFKEALEAFQALK